MGPFTPTIWNTGLRSQVGHDRRNLDRLISILCLLFLPPSCTWAFQWSRKYLLLDPSLRLPTKKEEKPFLSHALSPSLSMSRRNGRSRRSAGPRQGRMPAPPPLPPLPPHPLSLSLSLSLSPSLPLDMAQREVQRRRHLG